MIMTNAASERFGRIAANYANSEVHATSPSIRRLHEVLLTSPPRSVCDVACGAGHVALSFAGVASRIVGLDPAPAMLQSFRDLAAQKGVSVETVEAFAEDMPVPSGSFDLVTSRLAPHHFTDIQQAVREMARITTPGGAVAIIDLEGDAHPDFDAFNHRLEMLHDPTHIRSYTATRWTAMLVEAGLKVEVLDSGLTERKEGVPLSRWCQIADSGAVAEAELRRLLEGAPAQALAALGILAAKGEFLMPVRTVLALGRKPMAA
jgi:ubiquinone/menaquinone biosynthesis C-methylase UbiE